MKPKMKWITVILLIMGSFMSFAQMPTTSQQVPPMNGQQVPNGGIGPKVYPNPGIPGASGVPGGTPFPTASPSPTF